MRRLLELWRAQRGQLGGAVPAHQGRKPQAPPHSCPVQEIIGMPSEGGSDPPTMPDDRWRIDPPIGDEPVTAVERLRDALDAHLPGWDDVLILGAMAAYLVALGVAFVAMAQ